MKENITNEQARTLITAWEEPIVEALRVAGYDPTEGTVKALLEALQDARVGRFVREMPGPPHSDSQVRHGTCYGKPAWEYNVISRNAAAVVRRRAPTIDELIAEGGSQGSDSGESR